MSYQNIGKNIARLRKEKNISQEELGKAVGISGQAVSKWESGGSPDIEMLESVADYFSVSIDCLFDRKVNDYSDFETELANSIINTEEYSEKFSKIFDYCFSLQKSLLGEPAGIRVPEILKEQNGSPIKSQILCGEGLSLMGISDAINYFLLLPKADAKFLETIKFKDEYVNLLKILSEPEILKALFLLYSIPCKPFTAKLFVNELKVSADQSQSIIDKIHSIGLIESFPIELDNESKQGYKFVPDPIFVGIIVLLEEFICHISNYYYYLGTNREKLLNPKTN